MQASSAQPPPDLSLSLPCSHAGLQSAQDRIEAFLLAAGLRGKAVTRLLLVVEEAVMNIAMHGGKGEQVVRLALHLLGADIVVTIEDEGRRFDPRDAPKPASPESLADAQPGGLGVHLMRSFAKSIDHQWHAGRNVLTLTLARD